MKSHPCEYCGKETTNPRYCCKKCYSSSRIGVPHSEEFKQKVSDSIKRNYELHPEIKERISKANSRKITFKCEAPGCPNYVKKSPAFAKNAEHHFCNTKCHGLWLAEINKGIPRTPEVCAKIRASMPRGENHPGWKGGISNAPYCEKFNNDLRERIRAFFNYECFMCGKTKEENGKRRQLLSVHHVNYDKMSCCNDVIPIFAPLCLSCHGKTTAGDKEDRDRWTNILCIAIDILYDGKSFYTKEEYEKIKRG